MQWTKVSVKYAEHVFSDASDSVFRTYIRLMLLVTSMEFAPNLEQVSHKLGKRKVESLLQYLREKEISIDVIIKKVMEDVGRVIEQREGNKIRQRKHRVTRDITPLDLDKTKIREDKNKSTVTYDRFNALWEQYPVKDGRKQALKSFVASVKTEQDHSDMQKALKNYKQHLKENEWKKPKNGATWFNNWRDWIDFKDVKKDPEPVRYRA